MMVVVIRIDVRVQEGRAHGAPLDGERQAQCEARGGSWPIVHQIRGRRVAVPP